VTTINEIAELQKAVKKVNVSNEIKSYLISIVRATREDKDVLSGVSTRASVALFKGSRALAFLEGRDFVLPDDVKKLAMPVLAHRVHVKPEAEMDDVTAKIVVERVLNAVPVPKI
jgi:MoxR-like ATPase